jgi:hypothetical protein
MKNFSIFTILMKRLYQLLISLKSLALPIIKSNFVKNTTSRFTQNKINSPFKSQGSTRPFSSTASLRNNDSEDPSNDTKSLE